MSGVVPVCFRWETYWPHAVRDVGTFETTADKNAVTCDACRWALGTQKSDPPPEKPVYGMCTGCGSVEVALVKVTGTRDLSSMGEHPEYPVGYGCELCS